MMGLLAYTSKQQRAGGHESQLQKTLAHVQQVGVIYCGVFKGVITTLPLFYIPKHSLSVCLTGGRVWL